MAASHCSSSSALSSNDVVVVITLHSEPVLWAELVISGFDVNRWLLARQYTLALEQCQLRDTESSEKRP